MERTEGSAIKNKERKEKGHDMQEISDSRQAVSTQDDVTELRLCEARMVVLHPGQLYRFTVSPGCRLCEAEAGLTSHIHALTEEEVRAVVLDTFLTTLGEMDGQCRANCEEQAARGVQAEAVAASIAQKLARRILGLLTRCDSTGG